MSGEALAGSCFHAYRHAVLGQKAQMPPWEGLDSSNQAGYIHAAAWVENFLGGDLEEGGSWKTAAANCYFQFCKAANETPLAIEIVPPQCLRAWEAFVRHAANMMDYDPSDDGLGVEGHELYWAEWAARKQQEATMPQSQVDAQRPQQGDADG